MFDPRKYKFICEFPQYRDVLNASDLSEYKSRLDKLRRNEDPHYAQVAGFSFEYVIGCWLELEGDSREVGVIQYQPTYARKEFIEGDTQLPDHGADGYAKAFVGNSGTRPALVQLKYVSNKTKKLMKFGGLPALVNTRLFTESELNVTFITNAEYSDCNNVGLEDADGFIPRKFKENFPLDKQSRIFVRVLHLPFLEVQFRNFILWQKIRIMSGLFENTEIDYRTIS